ncbi:MAG: NEW3 domain-containing protein [Candidatus Limnocylindrales bacterium]
MPVLLRAGLAAGLALSSALAAAGTAGAATLTFTTQFPAIVADAGGSATFALTLKSSTATTVHLSVPTAPDGWTTTLRGGGSIVDAVYATTTAPSLDLEVKVPTTATPGTYKIVVRAADDAGDVATLPLEVRVPTTTGGGVLLTAQFPNLKGPASATYPFSLTLENDSSQQATFTLSTSGPPGWTVVAQPTSSSQAATIAVDAGASTQIAVTVTPPTDAAADTYQFSVQATGGPTVASADLQVQITGNYTMNLTTPDGRLNAQVSTGSATPMTLTINNTGSAPLDGVTLSATPPQGWTVTFDPATVPTIAAGDTATVTASITPADNAIAGDYAITFTAKNDQASGSVDIRTTVQTSIIWGIVGLAAIGLVFIGLFFVFRRYGRR